MRVMIIQEAICAPDESWPVRYRDSIAEAIHADRHGFDLYGLSEQHFAHGEAIVSAPEIVLAAVAAVTKNITLRIASVNMLPYNHPLRVAEQIATLDLISNGRMELGGARSNNPYTLDGFGIDAKDTRNFRGEHLNILSEAFSTGYVEYKSEFYSIPKRRISPWPVGRTAPPVHLSASGIDSHRDAGLIGVGAMTGLGIVGWEYVGACVAAYKEAVKQAKPVFGKVTNRAAAFSAGVSCHADRQVARDTTRANTLRFVEVILDFFLKIAERSPDYQYFRRLNEIVDRKTDLDYLIDATPYVISGNPDDIIKSSRKLYEMGFDDLIWRIDGMGHKSNMDSIEMIGKHVLPELHSWPERENCSPVENRAQVLA